MAAAIVAAVSLHAGATGAQGTSSQLTGLNRSRSRIRSGYNRSHYPLLQPSVLNSESCHQQHSRNRLGSSSQTVVNLIGPDFIPAIINSSSGAKFAGRITVHHGIFGTFARGSVLNRWKALVIIAILLGGCAAQQQKVEPERKMVIQFNESQVMVVTGDLNQSYKILGQINYTEPVSGEAIDTDHINARLRRMAIDRYQDQVDAIINVASTTNSSDGFEVSGEAVEIKGPCSFCRHKELVEVTNDETNRSIAATGGDLTGVWTGNLSFGCVSARARCLKHQDISFTFLQQETSVSGFYQCSSRDHPCVAHQYGGRIVRVESAPHGLLIKVRMDDGASCRFGTFTQERDEMKGVCICNELEGKPERFWWEVRRAY